MEYKHSYLYNCTFSLQLLERINCPRYFVRLCLLVLVVITTTHLYLNPVAYASIANTNSEEWVDNLTNTKILFVYELNKPTINNLNELNFTVDDLKTGNNLKNVTADVTVMNYPDPTFKFDNITSSNGHLYIKCPFLNEGKHQVIVNLRLINNRALASFNLTVPVTSNSS
jgi:hypothetical protein